MGHPVFWVVGRVDRTKSPDARVIEWCHRTGTTPLWYPNRYGREEFRTRAAAEVFRWERVRDGAFAYFVVRVVRRTTKEARGH